MKIFFSNQREKARNKENKFLEQFKSGPKDRYINVTDFYLPETLIFLIRSDGAATPP